MFAPHENTYRECRPRPPIPGEQPDCDLHHQAKEGMFKMCPIHDYEKRIIALSLPNTEWLGGEYFVVVPVELALVD